MPERATGKWDRRAVVVTRATAFEELMLRHATRGQARFFLESRGQNLEVVEQRHERALAARKTVEQALPPTWRVARVQREHLDRFLFERDDMVMVVGQDGLVANVAKYLDGQKVLGFNPAPDLYDGVLVPHDPAVAAELIQATAFGEVRVQQRSMVEARLDGSQTLLALNEIFIGQAGHQSARYHIKWADRTERQSSSGVIVATGTGATGWACSVNRTRAAPLKLPAPQDPQLAFFVREAFPSRATRVGVDAGLIARGESLQIQSRMNDSGVVFGDGIEEDFLAFHWGCSLEVRLAERRLHLVAG